MFWKYDDHMTCFRKFCDYMTSCCNSFVSLFYDDVSP